VRALIESLCMQLPRHSDSIIVVPYSLCTNDSKYAPGRAFGTSDDYFTFLRDAFDVLYEEGGKMMSVGLHSRLIGHPARMACCELFSRCAVLSLVNLLEFHHVNVGMSEAAISTPLSS
jgi:hypothetical protein